MRRIAWFAVLVVLVFAFPCRADRAAVERVLGKMQAAVRAADVDGYLAHVSRADAIFYKEQYNWAKDLKRRPVTSFDLTIGEAPEGETREFGADRARFEMVLAWKMEPEKEGGRAIDRTLSLPVVFVLDSSGQWVFAGEDWMTLEGGGEAVADAPSGKPKGLEWVTGKRLALESKDGDGRPGQARKSEESGGGARRGPSAAELDALPQRPRDVRFQGPESGEGAGIAPARGDQRRVRVKYFPGFEDVARRIVRVLPDVRDHVDEGFGERIDRVQEVKLYPSMKHLQESIYLSYVDGLSGWNEPEESIKLLANNRTSAAHLRSLLAHEYGHVATFEFGPRANDMPWWVLEGVAELSSERFAAGGKDADAMVIRWERADRLGEWADLADFHKVQASSQRDLQAQVYKQGHHMLGYISERFGKDGRNRWLRSMSQGKSIDEATKEALGMSFNNLDDQWAAAVTAMAEKDRAAKAAKTPEAEKPASGKGEPEKKDPK